MLPSIETFAKGSFATVAGVSTVAAGLLYYGQNFLIYPSAFPPGSRTEVPVPTDFGLPYDDLVLHTPDGVTLRSYLLLQRRELAQLHAPRLPYDDTVSDADFASTRPTIIMFHGNGGNHGHRLPLAKVFYVKMRCNVLMACYRGYGLSDGTPSEKGLCIDAQTALDYLTNDPHLSKTPIILFGQSIGGAVSIDLASRNTDKIAALILENTFTSLPALVPHALPLLGPFSFLCHQKWDSARKAAHLAPRTPVLLLSGLRDEVVPAEHMRALREVIAARGPTKFVEFENGTHNDTCVQPGYWAAVSEFVAGLAQAGKAA